MRSKVVYFSSLVFVVGMFLIALSYASFIAHPSLLASILSELGVALAVASLIGASVDSLFHRYLVAETRAAAEQAAASVRGEVQELSEKVAHISRESAGVLERVPIMSCCLQSGISNIYQSRSNPAAETRIMALLEKAERRIDIMGISLRTFFQGGGKLNNAVNEIMKRSADDDYKGASWRVLVIDPECEQAHLRSQREELPTASYDDSNLFREVNDTIKIIETRYKQSKSKIDLHVYRGAPSCFLLLVDDLLFIEQYHYGRERGQRAAELVPLLEFESDSTMYKELEGHFKYMWEELSKPPLQ